MFNIGPAEIIVILLIALLVVGPKRLPEVGRTIGKGLREFRRASDEVRYSFESHLDEPDSFDEVRGNGAKAEGNGEAAQKRVGPQPGGAPAAGEQE